MNLESFLNAYNEDTTLKGTVCESKHGSGEIFHTHPDRPGAHPASRTMITGYLTQG